MFTRNYLAGVVHLDMPTAHARRGIQLVQGPVGTLVALLVAIPFSVYDYQALGSARAAPRRARARPGGRAAALRHVVRRVVPDGLHLGAARRLPVPDAAGHRRLPLPLAHRGRAAREAVSPLPGHERARRHHRARLLPRERGLRLVHGRRAHRLHRRRHHAGAAGRRLHPALDAADLQDGPHRQGRDGGPAAASREQRDARPGGRRAPSQRTSRPTCRPASTRPW